MLIIQSGKNVYGVDKTTGKLKQLPLTYDEYPTSPTPESCNASIDWLINFLKRKALPYGVFVDDEESRGPLEPVTIVYADIRSGNTVKSHLALYTVATAITTSTTQSLETTLYEELT